MALLEVLLGPAFAGALPLLRPCLSLSSQPVSECSMEASARAGSAHPSWPSWADPSAGLAEAMAPALASALQLAPDGPARLPAAYGRLKGADVTKAGALEGALGGALQEAWGPPGAGPEGATAAAAATKELLDKSLMLAPGSGFRPLVKLAFNVGALRRLEG